MLNLLKKDANLVEPSSSHCVPYKSSFLDLGNCNLIYFISYNCFRSDLREMQNVWSDKLEGRGHKLWNSCLFATCRRKERCKVHDKNFLLRYDLYSYQHQKFLRYLVLWYESKQIMENGRLMQPNIRKNKFGKLTQFILYKAFQALLIPDNFLREEFSTSWGFLKNFCAII